MDEDDIANLHERASEALSRVRLATDLAAKALWQALAEEYLAKVAERLGLIMIPRDPRYLN